MDHTNIVVIATFYHFAHLPDYQEMKTPLLDFCQNHHLKGTILLANEGINCTISGSQEAITALLEHLRSDIRFSTLEWKESYLSHQPFAKMKVRLKQEIVKMGIENLDMSKRGQYIEAKDWNQFIMEDDVIVIDTRNEYETRIGTFSGSIHPNTKHFRHFPQWATQWAKQQHNKNKKIAMFCTGGVRCEKSTAFMKTLGFSEVYHLKGGILQYLDETANQEGTWLGECFVFDDRAAVGDQLKPTGKLLCKKCQAPVAADDLKHGPTGKIWCHSCIKKYRSQEEKL